MASLRSINAHIELFGTGNQARSCFTRILWLAVVASVLTLRSTALGGAVWAWGNNSDGQCSVPPNLPAVTAVAGGGLHSLALTQDGRVLAWGWNVLNETNVPPGLANVVAIAANYGYSLALKRDGTVVGWGTVSNTIPAGLTNIAALAAGLDHCLALRRNGTVVSWGNSYAVPANLTNVIGIAAGDGHSVAVTASGQVVAWGKNTSGQADVPADLTNAVAVAAGNNHSLALRSNGRVVAWGDNADGQTSVPSGLANVVAIAAGGGHNLALKADGTITLWGRNNFGQASPSSLSDVVGISGGAYHSLALVGDASPVITGQPMNQTAMLTREATFRVLAVGSRPLRYYWFHNGTLLPGANAAALTLTDIEMSDAGLYHAIVSNVYGAVTSSPAMLTPVEPPLFVSVQPAEQNVSCGDQVGFQAIAGGFAPLSYQWRFQGTDIAGATNSDLVLPGILTNQAGGYSVVVTNVSGIVTSAVATLAVAVESPVITSPLTAVGTQGSPFAYTITALHAVSFSALGLPPGLTLNPLTGVISGTLLEAGSFETIILAANSCGQTAETLVVTIGSAIPVITSGGTVTGTEETAIASYRITATQTPTSFGAANLPSGLSLDANTGIISGAPIFAGTFTATISASNMWGVGSARLQFNVANRVISGLAVTDVSYNYHSPYLLDFEFTLRDGNNNGIVTQPSLLSAVCMENTHPGVSLALGPDGTAEQITATTLITNYVAETGVYITRNTGKVTSKITKTYLVLDYTESISDPILNGDANGDGISDGVDFMVSGAQYFVNQQPADAQIGVYEFHRDDLDPSQVLALTKDKALLNNAIAGIWTNNVNWFYAGSRCWDAVDAAILALGAANPDEQHHVIFISDGLDSSSAATPDQVIEDAQAGNVRVHCIAFGDNADTNTLGQITSATGGRMFLAEITSDLFDQFALISKDIQAQYTLRWASLRRDATEIAPFFLLSYQGYTAAPAEWTSRIDSTNREVYTSTFEEEVDDSVDPPVTNLIETIETNIVSDFFVVWENRDLGGYVATNYVGNVTEGALRLALDEEVKPTGINLRATYIPRYIRQLRLRYRPNWPCSASLNATNAGEMLYGWNLIETNDVDGSTCVLISSTNPASITTSLPFPGFGPLLTFTFKDVLTKPKEAFSFITVDNSIYTGIPAGGQKFLFEPGNTNNFVTSYPALPYGTPVPWLMANGITSNFAAAETNDFDGDRVLTWQEYRANTNPKDKNSRFAITSMTTDFYGRYEITFTTASNRWYRAEASEDLVNWETLEDNIPGTGTPITVTDPQSPAVSTRMNYRVRVW